MPIKIEDPSRIASPGTMPKLIDEYIGMVNTGHDGISIARMRSPSGWTEPGQEPEFDEFTVVLRGMLKVEHRGGCLEIRSGQAVVCQKGEWIRYSTPEPEGADYIAVCVPAFSPKTVHRDPEVG